MEFKKRTLAQISDMVCGNFKDEESFFNYRRSSYLTQFFQDCDTDHVHDGSTRGAWVAETLRQILAEPQPDANTPPETFLRVIRALMDQGDAKNEDGNRVGALALLNASLVREGFEAFYGPDKKCYLRHLATGEILGLKGTPSGTRCHQGRRLPLFAAPGTPKGTLPYVPLRDLA